MMNRDSKYKWKLSPENTGGRKVFIKEATLSIMVIYNNKIKIYREKMEGQKWFPIFAKYVLIKEKDKKTYSIQL